MFITVKLLNGYAQELTYLMPDGCTQENLRGAVVRIPLRNRVEHGLIINVHDELSLNNTFTVRKALAIEPFPRDDFFTVFIEQVSSYYALDPIVFYRRLRYCIKHANQDESYSVWQQPNDDNRIQLTDEQQTIVDALSKDIKQPCYQPSVLHGVTGSGKTEVYKALINQTYDQGRTTVFLVPDVSLAVQFTNLFRAQLCNTIPIFGFHSASSIMEKRLLWNHLLQHKPALIIGVHLPVLLPLPLLGLIIVDE